MSGSDGAGGAAGSPLPTRGARIRWRREGAGPGVLLVQGVGVPGAGWRPQVEALRDRWSLLSFDHRGLPGSPLEGGPVTVEAMAADALALADAAGWERFHLAGHSLGGIVAQEIALRAPARVRSLALLCTFAHGPEGARLSPALLPLAIRTRLGTRAMRRAAFLELIVPPQALAALDPAGREALAARFAALFERDLGEAPRIVDAQLEALGRYDAFERLPALGGIPTLVLSAALDRIAPPSCGATLAAAIPGARFEVIPDAGHAVTILQAEAVNALLEEHWRMAAAPQGDPRD